MKKHLRLLLFLSLFPFASGFAQDSFITTWQTDNPGTSGWTSITIPTHPYWTYNYDVDWNDDGIFDELGITGDVTHNFGSPGTYTIRIQGDFPHIYFNDTGDKAKIISIDQWGNNVWSSMSFAFFGCVNLTCQATDAPDLSNATQLNHMFSDATSFNADLSNWDISNITTMSSMFEGATSFNSDISNWDVSNVIGMSYMFRNATSFNADLNNWDVSSISGMNRMFEGATSFNSDISNWDVSNVCTMSHMFRNATSFISDLSNWDVSNVCAMNSMFEGATSFNADLSNWDVSNASPNSGMNYMFKNATSFNSDLSNWDVSNVNSMVEMFYNASSFNSDLSNWDYSNVSILNDMLYNSGLSTYNYDQTLIGWANAGGSPKNLGSVDGLEYCIGKSARDFLIASGWTITNDNNSCTLTSEQTDNCYTAATIEISTAQGNNNQWLPVADASGNYICSINANGNDLGSTIFDVYLSSTDRTVAGGNYYMNRDVAISPTTQPSSDVCVRFYYTDSELSALIAADPTVIDENDLNISKTPSGCTGSYDGSGIQYGTDDAGSLGPGAIFLEECFSSFSNFHAHGVASPLPVELLSFEGKAMSDHNLLNWSTASEINNRGFEIERSVDGSSWLALDFVNGNGDSGVKVNYVFRDIQPTPGANYYRLKQIDFDGTYQYSNIVFIENRTNNDVQIYPNPSEGIFFLAGAEQGEVIIQNQLGETIHTTLFQNSTLDLSHLPKGVYIIQIASKNQMSVHKVLIR